MGAGSQILLVAALLASGSKALAGDAVSAKDNSAFWLWSGVKTTPEMQQAQTVYLHQGEVVTSSAGVQFVPLGLPVSKLSFPSLWLTVRFTTLDLPETLIPRITRLMLRWQAAGNQLVGLQIDFDAGSYQLASYAEFLQKVRQQLPPQFALGVTGLLDWAKTGSVATLNELPVDELVIQSYQGRKTVPNYAAYLPALLRLERPFKMGIVQHGVWRESDEKLLATSPWYRGTVVFLLNPRADDSSRKGYR